MYKLLDECIRAQAKLQSVGTPHRPERHHDLCCIDAPLIDDVNDTSLGEEQRKVVVIDSEAIIKENDAFLVNIEANGGEYFEFFWGTGGPEGD